tara:strand:- start:605 stop:1567 length:963 start_codon:yes stop_codon:yes gene_type:complete
MNEIPITGTELANEREVEKLMRDIHYVLDFSVAERLTESPQHPANPWVHMKGWRNGKPARVDKQTGEKIPAVLGWKDWKADGDSDYAFRSHAWGILPLPENTPLTWIDSQGLSSACPSKGQVTPINTNPYFDTMKCEPDVTQLCYVVRPAEQYGIGNDAILVRSIYPSEFPKFNPEIETGLAIQHQNVTITGNGAIQEDRYSLIEHFFIVDENGEKQAGTRTIPFYVDDENRECLYLTGTSGRAIVDRALSRMTGPRYRYCASFEVKGDLIDWMDKLRGAMWGEEVGKQQIKDAEDKINASNSYGDASIDLLMGSHKKSA